MYMYILLIFFTQAIVWKFDRYLMVWSYLICLQFNPVWGQNLHNVKQ